MAIDYTKDIVAFIRDLYRLETGPAIMPPHLQEWLYTCFPLPDGHPVARNILDSRSKKQGKSATAGAVALYMASRERYAEVVIAAADRDQAKDRVFRSVKFAVENHPAFKRAKVYKDVIELDQGSTIQAIPQDWRGAAGGNYAGVIFDELHVYTQEFHRRLYDELVIPPTKPYGVRWITSYAGFLGESELLHEIWNKALTGERQAGELPIYALPGASLLALIDQGEASWRMPWTTPEYMREIRETERPNTYRRLWLNEWVSNESEFIPPEVWEACRSVDVRLLKVGGQRRAVFGADASTSRDLTALVGVVYDRETNLSDVVYVRTWKPGRSVFRSKPTIDLDETIKAEILDLNSRGLVEAVYYDPYQLHSIALDLLKAGVKMVELPQTAARTEADQALYDALISRTLRHYGDPVLDEHIRNAVAIETPRGFRLAKERTTRKIDAAVALSMAHYGATQLQKAFGELKYIDDPFYYTQLMPEGMTGKYIGGHFLPIKPGTEKHQPGVTIENCRLRNKGCEACARELEASGYWQWYAEDGQRAQEEAERRRIEAERANDPEWIKFYAQMYQRRTEDGGSKVSRNFWQNVERRLGRKI